MSCWGCPVTARSSTTEAGLASRAGTNQGLITYHFRSKDELWRAAADRIFGIFAVAPECRRLTGLDPGTEKAIETHAEFVARLLVP